ncbi:MarR family transcriptional regulator [Nocardioides sp.]|uniref:MarR family winged helix-turn-helix transcriptional regulator n=1 Tax=Nocardioides sp. TaxID=35761 RepID=UPI001A28B791|nr:MarR family transcriptional regulator [Nocardioides sp.]MBJ7356827.1 MarR family transcriptional regulator [Nocardioides sp.]
MTQPGDSGPEREVLVELVLRTFRLNGMFLQVAEGLARPAGLTAAWWQVLGAVLREPLTVAGIAREMGLARQSVQRVADLLVDNGLAEYRANPAHARAKLLAPTRAGWDAIDKLRGNALAWAGEITAVVGEADLRDTVEVMQRLIDALSAD